MSFELGYASAKEVLDDLARFEPVSVQGQAPIVWDRAEGVYVYDIDGRQYLDWSSGVLVANVGHGRPEIVEAIVKTASKPLLFTYSFPSAERAALLREMADLLPRPDDKVFLLSTGSEAIEVALKLSLTHALRTAGEGKRVVVSFERGFHGRTMGAQLAGGSPALKEWLFGVEAPFVQVPFPDGYRTEDTSFDLFETTLAEEGVDPFDVAVVIMESYQGGGASFAPAEYVRSLESWCRDNDAVLVMDEVQAGYGRTGTWFAYEHYGITPDLVCCGKGISSSLPLAAVVGRRELLDQYAVGAMSSTHGGHPICAAAALANLRIMRSEEIVGNAASVGEKLGEGLHRIAEKHPSVGAVHGRGMVYALHMVVPGTKEPDAALATAVVKRCCDWGLMLFAPVGFGGANVKVCPPLVMTEEQVDEGLGILEEAIAGEEARRG